MTRLILCDIDGTLLPEGATAIQPEIFRQIARLEKKHIAFCPASGRQYTSLRKLFAPVAERLYYLCENGAVIFGPGDPGPMLSRTEMEREGAVALCRDILAQPRCEVIISGADTSYLCPKEGDVVALVRDFVGNNVALLARPEEMPEPIVKVSAYCRDGAAEVEPVLAPRWRGRFRGAVAGERWLDFTLADKGTGLERLCAVLGVDPGEVTAFGDSFNDVPMLELAGSPWLMAGAAEPLRRRFPRQCRRVEEVLRTL